jgi:hypothetical protein
MGRCREDGVDVVDAGVIEVSPNMQPPTAPGESTESIDFGL